MTPLFQHCGRGHIAACIQLDDTISVHSVSVYEVSNIWLVHESCVFAAVLVTNALYIGIKKVRHDKCPIDSSHNTKLKKTHV